jgi:hypothetical protein
LIVTVKYHDSRKDELPNGVFVDQLAQACSTHEQPAVAYDAKERARVLGELALLLAVQKFQNGRARGEQKQVHLIFERNARIAGFNKDLAIGFNKDLTVLAALELLAACVSGNAAANLGVSGFRIVVIIVKPQQSLSPKKDN